MANEGRATARFVIDRQTLLPLGLVVGIVGAIIIGVLWQNNQFAGIDLEFANVKYELQTIKGKVGIVENNLITVATELEEKGDRCWKVADARSWAGMLQALNPTTKIPEVTAEQYRGIDAAGNPLHGP